MAPSSKTRLANDEFNQLAPFGKNNGADDPISSGLSSVANLATCHMPLDYCIRLFVQSVILNAFFSRDFPEIGLTQALQGIIEGNIQLFCQNPFPVGTCTNDIKLLRDNIQTPLKNLTDRVREGKLGFKDDWSVSGRERFIVEIEQFVEDVKIHLSSFESLLANLEDNSQLSPEMMTYCLKFIQAEHEVGKAWVRSFFEYNALNHAHMSFKHYAIRYDRGDILKTAIETLGDQDVRYIQLTFSPQRFLIREFEKLALQIFHEYISHLSAGIYCPLQAEDEQPVKDVATSFRKVPTELDEGWMMHTAQTFIRDKGYELLNRPRQYMQENIQGSIDEWIRQLMHPCMADRGYVGRAAKGGRLAADFLNFLRRKVCDGNEQTARSLYYRLSFDLITRYPLDNFHLSFMNTLECWMRKSPDDLAKAIQQCLNNQGGFIDLDLLWTRLKQRPPRWQES